jgi:hypothetical protein
MSKDRPDEDSGGRADKSNFKQTDEPWKGNPEKEQAPPAKDHDLETWQKSNTH